MADTQIAQKPALAPETRVREVVEAAVAKCGASRDNLVAILTEVNQALGYIPPEAFNEVGHVLHTPVGQLFSVATFYKMLSTRPHGRHLIQFCESAPCHVVGGREVWRALQETLQLEPGETSADGKWTLSTTSCLGVCAVGPVITIDEDIYGNVTPQQVADILERYA
ncbi:MAG TPA: NADH-quinone oxidoreductase subunit NuoE [Anaerolineae bacterium]|jgi:NADH:ubiquinone oxidoreductase subunit E